MVPSCSGKSEGPDHLSGYRVSVNYQPVCRAISAALLPGRLFIACHKHDFFSLCDLPAQKLRDCDYNSDTECPSDRRARALFFIGMLGMETLLFWFLGNVSIQLVMRSKWFLDRGRFNNAGIRDRDLRHAIEAKCGLGEIKLKY